MESMLVRIFDSYDIRYLFVSSSKIVIETGNITAKWNNGVIAILVNNTLTYIGFTNSAKIALSLIIAFLYKMKYHNEVERMIDTLLTNGFKNIKEVIYPGSLFLTAEKKRNGEHVWYINRTKNYELVASTAPRYITVTIRIYFPSSNDSLLQLLEDLDRVLHRLRTT